MIVPVVEIPEYTQTVAEQLDYAWSGEDQFEETEIISTATWTVPPELTSLNEVLSGKVASILLGVGVGAVVDGVYSVTGQFKTSGGTWSRVYERTFNVRVVAQRGVS